MLSVKTTRRFLQDVKRSAKRGRDIDKLEAVVDRLQSQEPLPNSCKDHKLGGTWQSHRECHIEPDWLLIYRIDGEYLILERTGNHSDLFQ